MRNDLNSLYFHSGHQKVILYPIICIDCLWNCNALCHKPGCAVINICTILLVLFSFFFSYWVSFSLKWILFCSVSMWRQNSESWLLIQNSFSPTRYTLVFRAVKNKGECVKYCTSQEKVLLESSIVRLSTTEPFPRPM